MQVIARDTKSRLMGCGKEEFLKHGFAKASLRTICAHASVTTGAFYFYFKSKADLFSAIIEDDLRASDKLGGNLADLIASLASTDEGSEMRLAKFVMDHHDLLKLLFDCSEGTEYEGFKDELLKKFDQTCLRIFDSIAPGEIDQTMARIIVRMKFAQFCEMIYGDISRDEAMRVTARLELATRCAFGALMGHSA